MHAVVERAIGVEGQPSDVRREIHMILALAVLVEVTVLSIAPLLPQIKAEYQLSAAGVATVMAAYSVARAASNLPVGLVAGRFPTSWGVALAAGLLAVGAFLAAFSPGFAVVLAGRALMGIGSAFYFVFTQYRLSALSTDANRGRLFGTLHAFMITGGTLGPALGGFVATAASWRHALVVTGFFSVMVVPLALFLNASAGAAAAPGHDPPHRAHAPAPLGRDRPVRLSQILPIAVATVVLMFFGHGFKHTVVPLFGATALRLSTASIGAFIALGSALRLFAVLMGGQLADRFSKRSVIVAGNLTLAVATLGFLIVTEAWSYALMVIAISVANFGAGLPVAMIADIGTPRSWGMLIGLNRMLGDLGAISGPLVLGIIIDAGGFPPAFMLTAGLLWGAAIFLALGTGRAR